MTPAIQTERLTHRFRRKVALENVNLEVPEGGMYALLGPNGAGKTTLLKLVLGLLRPTAGRINIRGRNLTNVAYRDRTWLGYVAERVNLPGWMTLRQCEAYLAPLYPTWDKELADHLRIRFRLDANTRIRRMSRGEQMKATLLTVLAHRPEVLVMDEPFTGMDALVKDELVYGLLELANSGDWTVLICSHDIGELEVLADWVGILDEGRLILSESMDMMRDRFRQVNVDLPPGSLIELSALPPTWLSTKRAGNRLSFVTSEFGTVEFDSEVRDYRPDGATHFAEPAGLRDVFIALASDGVAGGISGGLA